MCKPSPLPRDPAIFFFPKIQASEDSQWIHVTHEGLCFFRLGSASIPPAVPSKPIMRLFSPHSPSDPSSFLDFSLPPFFQFFFSPTRHPVENFPFFFPLFPVFILFSFIFHPFKSPFSPSFEKLDLIILLSLRQDRIPPSMPVADVRPTSPPKTGGACFSIELLCGHLGFPPPSP